MKLSDLLKVTATHQLRRIAANLHLRKHVDQRKDWINAINQVWLNPADRAHRLSTLSLPACRALWRLVAVAQMPAALFFTDFGPLHDTGRRQTGKTLPGKMSKTSPSPAQELYNLGLLYGATGAAVDQAHWLAIAADLRADLAAWLQLQLTRQQNNPPPPLLATRPSPPASFVLLHDLTQLLAFVRQSPTAFRPAGHFSQADGWQRLQPRLWALHDQDGSTQPTANERDWLRLLLFLAHACGLLQNGVPQPSLWHWLRQPVAKQLVMLWQGWLAAPATLRNQFEQVPIDGIHGWLAALSHLSNQPSTPFSAVDLCHQLLSNPGEPRPTYFYWFTKLSEIDQHLEQLLVQLALYGVVESVGVQPAPFLRPLDEESALPLASNQFETIYRITELGWFLLQTRPFTEQIWHWQRGSDQWLASNFVEPANVALPVLDDSPLDDSPLWTLYQRSDGDPESLLIVAPFCSAIKLANVPDSEIVFEDYNRRGLINQTPTEWVSARHAHQLSITPRSLALASSQGYHAADLWQLVQQSGLQLRPRHWQLLQHWLQAGRQLVLQPAQLFVTHDADLMQRIQTNTALRPFLGEMFTPTVATWQGDPQAWRERLQQQGFFAQIMPANQPAAAIPVPANHLALDPADAAVLWLALQVYEVVGKFAALPLRVTPETVRQLWDALATSQQANLTSQLAQLATALESAIDQLPFAPPKEPSDPEQWRPLINQAIKQKADLEMIHWSAGRNMAVQRRVTPFYIDEQRFGGPALRAWCHSSGHDLWFRLDRIQRLEVLRRES